MILACVRGRELVREFVGTLHWPVIITSMSRVLCRVCVCVCVCVCVYVCVCVCVCTHTHTHTHTHTNFKIISVPPYLVHLDQSCLTCE